MPRSLVNKDIKKAQVEIEKGLKLCHCKRCGCMRGSLQNIYRFLRASQAELPADFVEKIKDYLAQLEPAESN